MPSIPDVLVVDDDPEILDVVASVLETEGYVVRTANNGLRALEQAQIRLPGVVLLDMRMPVMDGREFSARLRALTGGDAVPVVVMSADQQAARKAQEIGAQGSLQKPFELEALFAHVARFLPSPAASGAG